MTTFRHRVTPYLQWTGRQEQVSDLRRPARKGALDVGIDGLRALSICSGRAAQEPSLAALRYRRFVKGLKSSFSWPSTKSRRQLLGMASCAMVFFRMAML